MGDVKTKRIYLTDETWAKIHTMEKWAKLPRSAILEDAVNRLWDIWQRRLEELEDRRR